MNHKMNAISVAMLAIAMCGCEPKPEQPPSQAENAEFDIPASLIVRMQNAYSVVRNKNFGIVDAFDGEEVFGLSQLGMENAAEIASRPRGEMKFSTDLLTEAERAKFWPFDVESFEAELESKMVRDEEGLYRLKPEFGEGVGGLKEDGLVAVNPTIRWVNHEMEQWATAQLDAVCNRMDDETFCKMSGDEAMPEGTKAWRMGEDEFFVISGSDGAWEQRDYMFVLWQEGKDPCVVASLNSFPNREEGIALLGWRDSSICANNVAVLEWQHRSQRLSMNPWRIKQMLFIAADEGVEVAKDNLKVLFDHIPEVFPGDEDNAEEQQEQDVE